MDNINKDMQKVKTFIKNLIDILPDGNDKNNYAFALGVMSLEAELSRISENAIDCIYNSEKIKKAFIIAEQITNNISAMKEILNDSQEEIEDNG